MSDLDDFDDVDDDQVSVPGHSYRRRTLTRAYRSRASFLAHLLGLLQRGMYVRTIAISRSSGQRERRDDEAHARRTPKRGRPPKPRRRGETDDDRRRRLAADRAARYRQRKKGKDT
jgi:hypothetical protein